MSTALVTGVSKGIGKSIAEQLLQSDWKVYGISRSQPEFTHQNFVWLEFDLMDFTRYVELSDLIPENLDLLVNNAGIAYKVAIDKLIELDLEKQWKMNVKAPVTVIRTLMSKLETGKIINISSIASLIDYEGLGVYAMTKAALNKFASQFAVESKIPIASILPSSVDTPLMKTLYPGEDSAEYLQPEEVAREVVKLAGEDFESGVQVILVNNELQGDINTIDRLPNRKIVNVDDLS